jgi:hypothetical protein
MYNHGEIHGDRASPSMLAYAAADAYEELLGTSTLLDALPRFDIVSSFQVSEALLSK